MTPTVHALYDLTTQSLSYREGGEWTSLAVPDPTLPGVATLALTATPARDIWCRGTPHDWYAVGPVGGDTSRAVPSRDGRNVATRYTIPYRGTCYLHDWGDSRWPGTLHHDVRGVLTLYDEVSAALARPFGFSPGALGLDVLSDTRHKHPEWFRPEELPLTLNHPRQAFVRPPRDDDGPWLHCFDMRAAFFAAARALRFPTGAAMHLKDPRLLFGPVGFATAEHAALADVAYNRRVAGPLRREGWQVQSVYRAALAHGQSPVVRDAYVYSQRHEALRAWTETLLSSLVRVRTRGLASWLAPILNALWKSLYVHAIGRLGSAPDFGGPRWYHLPVWHAMIEGEVARRAWGLVGPAERPMALCLLTDEVIYASPDSDPDAVGARVGEAPGRLVHRWSARGVPPAAVEAAKRGDAVSFRDACRDTAR